MTGTAETTHFGLTRVGVNEALSKNGYAALDGDRVRLDSLLYAFLTHVHSGQPALGDPTDAPTLTTAATGGSIPAGTTVYYRVAFVDEHNLETAGSPEASVTTAPLIDAPSGPACIVIDSGGTIGTGTYSYAVTFVDAFGGETTGSSIATVAVNSGSNNTVQLVLPELPSGAVQYRIYRTRPGQTSLYQLATTTSGTFVDTGLTEDQTITVPFVNSTNSTNAVTVEIPLGFIPEGCASWRIYRATTSNGYTGSSLVHQVVETSTDTGGSLLTTWIDTGDALFSGFPMSTSATVPQGSVIDLSNITGSLELSALPRGGQCLTAVTGSAITEGQTLLVTEAPGQVKPVRFTAYFPTPPTTAGVTVRIRFTDTASNYVELACSPTVHLSGDPAGYYHAEYPLLEEASFQAETGTLLGSAQIDNDAAAANGQAVTIADSGDAVTIPLGTLDSGTYSTFASLRVLAFDPSVTGPELTLTVIRTDTNATVGSPVSLTLVSSNPSDPTSAPVDYLYTQKTGPVVTAPGGVPLALQISKSVSSQQSYDIDSVLYQATIPTLQAGQITATAHVDGGVSDAVGVNAVLWF